MICFESRRSRTLIGRIEDGERVEEALLRIARDREVTTGWVSATGSLRSAELAFVEDGGQGEPRRFEGGLELLQLSGNVSSSSGGLVLEARAHLARATDNGVQVLGGRLVDAVAHAVEFRIECFDDLGLRREPDEATGLRLWRGEAVERGRAERPAAPSAPGVSWASAAQASLDRDANAPAVERRRAAPSSAAPLPFVPDPIPARKKADEDDVDLHHPERGDFVDHKQFGLCRVENLAEDGGLLIRLETGRRKLIKLDFLDVLAPREEGSRKIYPLRPKRR